MELWNILPHPSPAHVVRLFAKKGEEKRGDFARSEKELERFIRSNIDYNTYVAPNPTLSTIGLRHNSNDVTHWSFLFFDVDPVEADRKSTRLNSSHLGISYAVFCLKKKKNE